MTMSRYKAQNIAARTWNIILLSSQFQVLFSATVTDGHVIVSIERSSSGLSPLSVDSRRTGQASNYTHSAKMILFII